MFRDLERAIRRDEATNFYCMIRRNGAAEFYCAIRRDGAAEFYCSSGSDDVCEIDKVINIGDVGWSINRVIRVRKQKAEHSCVSFSGTSCRGGKRGANLPHHARAFDARIEKIPYKQERDSKYKHLLGVLMR